MIEDIGQREVREKTLKIFREYYEDNLTSFFEAAHPAICFLSIGKNQLVEGREQLKAAIGAGLGHANNHTTRYELLDMSCRMTKFAENIYAVLLQMRVVSYFKDGNVQEVNQRVDVIWKKFNRLLYAPGDLRRGWFIMQVHASIGLEAVRPVRSMRHMAECMVEERIKTLENNHKYEITDTNRYVHYVGMMQIVEMEIIDKQTHVYLFNGEEIVSNKSLSSYEEELAFYGFVRVHKSYLVNSLYVRGIKDYMVELDNDDMIPISHRKYSEVRKMIRELMEKRKEEEEKSNV